jgi:hypothetical protein
MVLTMGPEAMSEFCPVFVATMCLMKTANTGVKAMGKIYLTPVIQYFT